MEGLHSLPFCEPLLCVFSICLNLENWMYINCTYKNKTNKILINILKQQFYLFKKLLFCYMVEIHKIQFMSKNDINNQLTEIVIKTKDNFYFYLEYNKLTSFKTYFLLSLKYIKISTTINLLNQITLNKPKLYFTNLVYFEFNVNLSQFQPIHCHNTILNFIYICS